MKHFSFSSLKIFFVVGIIFNANYFSFAQNNFVRQWDHRYGGTANDKLQVFFPTSDHGFFIGGSSLSSNDGNKSQPSRGGLDYYVIKTDSLGLKIWDARFGGSLDDELTSAHQTSDGGFILGGSSRSNNNGDKSQSNWDNTTHNYNDYWIVKIDAAGNKQWDKRFGGIYDDKMNAVIQTNDGGFLLGGYSESTASGDRTETTRGGPDYWIVKTDASGNKQWDKRFGGNRNEQLTSLIQTFNGNFVLGGFTWSDPVGDNTQSCRGPVTTCDYWVVKVSATGNKIWDKRYGGAANDNLISLSECNDHGLIIGGYSYSSSGNEKTDPNNGAVNTADFWIIKTDVDGNKKWDKTIGGNMNEDEFGKIYQANDGGYFLSGASYSGTNGDKTEINLGAEQSWVVKLDESGNVKWDKTIFNPGHDEKGFGYLLNDGSIVLANYSNGAIGGYKTEDDFDANHITYDLWIVKLQNAVPPVADFIASNQTVCCNTCINFIDRSVHATSYHWIFQGASVVNNFSSSPTNVCYYVPGNYDVTLIVSNDFGSDTVVMTNYIHVLNRPPAIQITQIGDTLFAPQGFASYQWYFQNSQIVFANRYYYVIQQSGNYSVSAFDINDCVSSAEVKFVTTGIEHLDLSKAAMQVFPNPAHDNFVVSFHFPDRRKSVTINIYNELASLVLHDVVNLSDNDLEYIINCSSWKNGIYLITLDNGFELITKKIIVDRER